MERRARAPQNSLKDKESKNRIKSEAFTSSETSKQA